MARMVFGSWASDFSDKRVAVHYTPRRVTGQAMACGREYNYRVLAEKDWRHVTCQQCLKHRPALP